MTKVIALAIVLPLLAANGWAQEKSRNYTAPPALAVHFLLNDFTTPQRIRATSLSDVLRHNQLAKVKEMYPGIGISYYNGLCNHIDLNSSLNASFAKVPLHDHPEANDNYLLLEGIAAIDIKLLTDRHMVTPFATIGIGASNYKGYYGAFMPLGGGIKINFFGEAALIVATQYRVPVTTETSSYHFVHSIGIAGILRTKSQ